MTTLLKQFYFKKGLHVFFNSVCQFQMGIIRDQIKIEPCPDGLVLKFNSDFLISACTFVRESSPSALD